MQAERKGGYGYASGWAKIILVVSNLLIDFIILIAAFALACLVRFDGIPPAQLAVPVLTFFPIAVLLQLSVNYIRGVYVLDRRFFGLGEAILNAQAALIGAGVLIGIRVLASFFAMFQPVPYGLILTFSVFGLLGMVGFRIVTRFSDNGRNFETVGLERLLGRNSKHHPINSEELNRFFQDRIILITGAGGSIGSELVRQVLAFSPRQVILLDKDENSLFEIASEVAERSSVDRVEVIADIRERSRVKRLLQRYRPEVVFHAAAYKQVPLMESNPAEAIANNVLGSQNLIELASSTGVRSFVLISTDKAVNPTSVMGASKRLAELILQREAQRSPTTIFNAVRFGNVLGSRGSVLPVFRKRISEGKNLQVTHPDVVRYFMTIREAVMLVIQTASHAEGGEIFVLDMGRPVKIVDLARQTIACFSPNRNENVEIEFTGLRPGEKLYEELLLSSERGIRSARHPGIYIVRSQDSTVSDLEAGLEGLSRAADEDDVEAIYHILQSMDLGFRPALFSGRPAKGPGR